MPRSRLTPNELCSPPTNRSEVATRLPTLLNHEGESPRWDKYLTSVYGHVPPHAYPIDMSTFTWLYHNVPLDVSPARLGPRCSARHGHAWVGPRSARWPESAPPLVAAGMFVQRYDPAAPDAYPLRDGVRNNSWVEVTHCARRGDALHGAQWLYVAGGSGVSVNVGRTLVMQDVKHAKQQLMRWGLDGHCSALSERCAGQPDAHATRLRAARRHLLDHLRLLCHIVQRLHC